MAVTNTTKWMILGFAFAKLACVGTADDPTTQGTDSVGANASGEEADGGSRTSLEQGHTDGGPSVVAPRGNHVATGAEGGAENPAVTATHSAVALADAALAPSRRVTPRRTRSGSMQSRVAQEPPALRPPMLPPPTPRSQ